MPLDVDNRKVALGFLGTAVVLAILITLVGAGDVVETFGSLDLGSVGLIVLSGCCWLAAWGACLRTVLGSLDLEVGRLHAIALYASAAFANNVTPFGQAGGEPFSALLISRATDAEYERSLAVIASVDAINFIPSIAFATLGLTYYAARFTVGDRIVTVAVVVLALAVGVPAIGYVLWRHRDRVRLGLVHNITGFLGHLGERIPRFTPPSTDTVRHRVTGFFDAITRVADDHNRLAIAITYSTIGWFFIAVTLWLSLRAFIPAPLTLFPVVLIIVPVATIASVTPLPGGAGGVEFVLVLMIVPTTGVTAATATTAALVYRGGTYWLSTAIGALSALALQRRTTR